MKVALRDHTRISVQGSTASYSLRGLSLVFVGAWLVVFFVVLAVWLGYMPSPITGALRWWDTDNRWHIEGQDIGSPAPSPSVPAMVLFCSALGCVIVSYFWAIQRANHVCTPSRRHLWSILLVTFVVGSIVLLLPVLFSGDLFSYIIYGRIHLLHQQNPYLVAPSAFADDPFYPFVFWRNTVSVYGPVWLGVADGLVWLAERGGGTIATTVLFFKLFGLACHLGNAVLIWLILGRWAPERRLVGTLLYAWNPLALIEFVSSGHNDALMLFLFLLGLWFITLQWEVLGLATWACSAAVKYVVIILIASWIIQQAMALHPMVREHELAIWFRRLGAMAWRGALVFAVCALLFTPFWVGPQTLRALFDSPPTQLLNNSVIDMSARLLPWLIDPFSATQRDALRLSLVPFLKLMGLLCFVGLWCWQSFRTRDRVTAWCWIALSFIVVGSGWFWPWYATWVLVLVALRRYDRLTISVLILSCGVLSLYVFLPYFLLPIAAFRAAFAFGPALGSLAWAYRLRWQVWCCFLLFGALLAWARLTPENHGYALVPAT